MHKQYFAKLLPIEGEIKEGDKCVLSATGKILDAAEQSVIDKLQAKGFMKRYKKVALFLCSRVVRVGDNLRTETGNQTIPVTGISDSEISTLQIGINNKKLFNVIGQISPSVTWINDGDDVAVEDIQHYSKEYDPEEWMKDKWGEVVISGLMCNPPRPTVHIKCSQCNIFH